MMHIPRVRNCGPSRWSARWKRSPTWPGRIECFSSILSTQGKLAFVLLYWAQRASKSSKHIIWRRGYKYRITTSCTYFFTLDGALILYLDARVDSEGLDQLGEGGAAASLLVESPTQLPHRKPVNPATEALRWSIIYIFPLFRKMI